MLVAPGGQLLAKAPGQPWVGEGRGRQPDRGRTSSEVVEDVVEAGDPADADDGDRDDLGDLVDDSQPDGLDGGARKPAVGGTQARGGAVTIESQCGHGADGADGIGTRGGHGSRDDADIRRTGTELDDERQVGDGTGSHGGGLGRRHIEADGLTMSPSVGASQVQLQPGRVRPHVQRPSQGTDVVGVVGADADDDGYI